MKMNMNTNTENKQTEINNSHTKTNNPNQQQRGAFDDLKDVFRISKNIEQEQEEKDDNIIVIRKSWWGVICGSLSFLIFCSVMTGLLAFLHISLWILALIMIWSYNIFFNIKDVSTTTLKIDLKNQQAFFQNYLGSDTTKKINTVSCYKHPIFSMYNSITVRGQGYGTSIGISVIRDYDKIKKLVDEFYHGK